MSCSPVLEVASALAVVICINKCKAGYIFTSFYLSDFFPIGINAGILTLFYIFFAWKCSMEIFSMVPSGFVLNDILPILQFLMTFL